MKSTYKLFGTVWDGIEDLGQMVISDCVQHTPTLVTMVSLSVLLSASTEDDVARILEPFYNSDAIAINMDYHFESENPIMRAFIEKRERQIKGFLMKKFKSVSFYRNMDKKVPLGATNA